jgi:hypothetical protein
MDEIFKILTFILLSSVKFTVGLPFVYLNETYDFTWLETNIYAIIGGMIGVIVFMHVSEWLIELWDRIRLFLFKKKEKINNLYSQPVADIDRSLNIHYVYIGKSMPPRKLFTRRNRKMVQIWRKYGLIGLAALTPVLFSIPIGTFFMTRLAKKKRKIMLYMFISICSWSILITTLFEILHIRSLNEILK